MSGYTYKVTTSAGVPLVKVPHKFWPEPGPMTVACWSIGAFDITIIGFIVSRLL